VSAERIKSPCFNPNCPACVGDRLHTEAEWENHPMRTHGYVHGMGWTHPEAERLHKVEVEAMKGAKHA
jgi:hypothetical protein